jgi:Flp pilus assembly protein TadD
MLRGGLPLQALALRALVICAPRAWALRTLVVCALLPLSACVAGLPPVAVAAQRHNDAGTALLAEGHLDDAEARFRLALEYHPHFAEAHLNLALVLLGRGRHAEAGEHLLTAVELDEDYAEAHGNLGVYYLLVGDVAQAERSFVAALAIDPGLREPRLNLAELWVAQERFREARAQLLRLVQVAPEDQRAHAWLAYCDQRLGRHAEALDRADKVLTRDPAEPVAHLVFAQDALTRGDWEATRGHAELAAEYPPTREAALATLAAMALVTHDLTGAAELTRTLLTQNPRSRVGLWLAAEVDRQEQGGGIPTEAAGTEAQRRSP